MEEQSKQQQFGVERIYIKDCSFESPMGAEVFTKQWKPKLKVNLNTRNKKLDDSRHEVVLMVTLTALLDDETAFLVEVQQAGLFFSKGLQEEQLRHALCIAAPNLLFPYLRETVDNLAIKAGFPPVHMQPVNFEALYAQAKAQQGAKEQTTH